MQGLLLKREMFEASVMGLKTVTRREGDCKKINENPENWFLDLFRQHYPAPKSQNRFWFNTSTVAKAVGVRPRFKKGEIIYFKEPILKREGKDTRYKYSGSALPEGERWSNKLFMGEVDARYFATITQVSFGRIWDLKASDIIAEGVPEESISKVDWQLSAFLKWKKLWQSINGKESWDRNIYVFVYQYEMNYKYGQ